MGILVPVEVQENRVRSLALTSPTLTSSAPPLGGLTPSVASESVVEPLMVHVIQYPTHQMVVPTHVCVERLAHINEDILIDAFATATLRGVGLEGAYVDGISLTHGAPGSRSHIWTFSSALNDFGLVNNGLICSCTNTNPWPYTLPSFIGNNYFCDTGDHDAGYVTGMYYPDEPLFDGQGCGPDSTCCQFTTPPWFCTELPQPTSDDLEIRICGNKPFSSEDVVISMININFTYVNTNSCKGSEYKDMYSV